MVVATDKVATDNRAAEEAMEKAVADKEAADNGTVDKAAVMGMAIGATGDAPAPVQEPSLVEGTNRAAAPSGFTSVCLAPPFLFFS
jgi:hypothetical protein